MKYLARFVTGVDVRDWAIADGVRAWFPYSDSVLLPESDLGVSLRALWAWREPAWARRTFAKRSYKEEGRPYYEWHQLAATRHQTPLALVWAYKHTGVNFSLSRGGCVFNKHAPFIKLRDNNADAYLALASVLNSSTGCFWLKQVCQDTGVGGIGGGIGDEAWEPRYEFGAGRVAQVPIPELQATSLAAALDAASHHSASLLGELSGDAVRAESLGDALRVLTDADSELSARMVSLQEELDWMMLRAYGLVSDALVVLGESAPPILPGQRAFEILLAREVVAGETETAWFERHGSSPTTEIPAFWPTQYRELVEQRIALIESDLDIGLIERPEHKRRWTRASWEERLRDSLARMVLDALDDRDLWSDLRLRSTVELTDVLRALPRLVEAIEMLANTKDTDIAATLGRLVIAWAVPHLAAERLSENGLIKRVVWERVWDLQRAEDRGEEIGTIPVPPKYASSDFRSGVFWEHRGKLDVPKERFVLVPNAGRGADISPVVGWAGWDERDLSRALAGRIMELREQDAVDAERVTPLLAGVLELLPWIHQWHPNSDALYGGPPGRYFEGWLDGQLTELAITRETLRAWRPPAPTRGRKAKGSSA